MAFHTDITESVQILIKNKQTKNCFTYVSFITHVDIPTVGHGITRLPYEYFIKHN